MTIPDSPSLHASTALTGSAWIDPTGLVDDPTQAQGIVCKRVGFGSDSAFSLFLMEGKLTVDVQTEDNRFSSAAVFSNNQWYHVAVVFDGSLPVEQRVSVYIDGVLDVTAAEDSAAIEPYTSDTHHRPAAQRGNQLRRSHRRGWRVDARSELCRDYDSVHDQRRSLVVPVRNSPVAGPPIHPRPLRCSSVA